MLLCSVTATWYLIDLTAKEWQIGKQMQATLSLCAAVSGLLGRDYVTASLVLPLMSGVIAGLSPGRPSSIITVIVWITIHCLPL
jgi:hypothetical protein